MGNLCGPDRNRSDRDEVGPRCSLPPDDNVVYAKEKGPAPDGNLHASQSSPHIRRRTSNPKSSAVRTRGLRERGQRNSPKSSPKSSSDGLTASPDASPRTIPPSTAPAPRHSSGMRSEASKSGLQDSYGSQDQLRTCSAPAGELRSPAQSWDSRKVLTATPSAVDLNSGKSNRSAASIGRRSGGRSAITARGFKPRQSSQPVTLESPRQDALERGPARVPPSNTRDTRPTSVEIGIIAEVGRDGPVYLKGVRGEVIAMMTNSCDGVEEADLQLRSGQIERVAIAVLRPIRYKPLPAQRTSTGHSLMSPSQGLTDDRRHSFNGSSASPHDAP